jgi:hypothetical protein
MIREEHVNGLTTPLAVEHGIACCGSAAGVFELG